MVLNSNHFRCFPSLGEGFGVVVCEPFGEPEPDVVDIPMMFTCMLLVVNNCSIPFKTKNNKNEKTNKNQKIKTKKLTFCIF